MAHSGRRRRTSYGLGDSDTLRQESLNVAISGISGLPSAPYEIAPRRGLAGSVRIAATPNAYGMALNLVHGSRTRPWGTIRCPGLGRPTPYQLDTKRDFGNNEWTVSGRIHFWSRGVVFP